MTMNSLTEEMQEYICDLCQYPCQIKDVGMLEEVCAECQVEEYVQNIRSLYDEKGGADNE